MNNDEYPMRTIERLISDHLQTDNDYLRVKVKHDSPCPGLELYGNGPYHEIEQCNAIGCENDTVDAWLKIGSGRAPMLCEQHLQDWIEHEAEIECELCAALFDLVE